MILTISAAMRKRKQDLVMKNDNGEEQVTGSLLRRWHLIRDLNEVTKSVIRGEHQE